VGLPENAGVLDGEVVLSTDEAHKVGDRVDAGQMIDIAPRSMLVLRQV
jgi:hypothetical protein